MAQATVTLHRATFGWEASFVNVLPMPDHTWIPLPFTAQAPIDTVMHDMVRRFPRATLYITQSR